MYEILDKINTPNDLKKLDKPELELLCSEIRNFLIESVSKTGGHLASNLGVVELTVALHMVYNLPKDKLVWDVGHQSYVHKILTGRKDRFDTLRKYKGLSGFPKTSESIYDSFNTGHSSTSVSAAVGMSRSRDLLRKSYSVAAIFGDGALTGGMIYEAINDLGHNKTPMVLVLNDNEMSISKNVGALSKYLRRLRQTKSYHNSKRRLEKALNVIPLLGKPIIKGLSAIKNKVKKGVLPQTLFDDLGIEYLGPVDGHNLEALINVFTLAKSMSEPVLVHVITKKGKGYMPAEKNPHMFHGVSPDTPVKNTENKYRDYSQCAGEVLCNLAKNNQNFVTITAAMPEGVGLSKFSLNYPQRFFDVGIAEEHAVTMSAGLAISGITPVFMVYSSFLQRSYDQILHDICLQNLHAVFLVDRAGVVGSDGETHHGLYDISFLSDMPNMTILSPSSFDQLEKMIDYAINHHKGPIAIRYPRGNVSQYSINTFEISKCYNIDNTDSENVLITTGRMLKTALDVKAQLVDKNMTLKVVLMPTVSPVPEDLYEHIKDSKYVMTLEDHSISGGLGVLVSSFIAQNNITLKFKAFAYPKEPVIHGTVSELDCHYGLDSESVSKTIKEFINA